MLILDKREDYLKHKKDWKDIPGQGRYLGYAETKRSKTLFPFFSKKGNHQMITMSRYSTNKWLSQWKSYEIQFFETSTKLPKFSVFSTDILARSVTFCNSAIIYLDLFVSKKEANSWLGPKTTIEQKAINWTVCLWWQRFPLWQQ